MLQKKEMKQVQIYKDISIDDEDDPVVQYMMELIDICTQGICFEIHRAIRLGHWELGLIDDEGQQEFEIVDEEGVDVFGQQPVKKQQECVCPNCSRTLAANRFAPHLEKCMGMGRNSSRIASRRLQNSGRTDEYDVENDVDFDWGYDLEKKGRKGKRDKEKDKEKVVNSPKRVKVKKGDNVQSGLVTNGNGGSRPGTPSSTASGDTGSTIKTGPSLQAVEALSHEEKVALLTQTCGAISEHTGKMCTRTGRCVQHTDEQRVKVRALLLGCLVQVNKLPLSPCTQGETDDVPWPPSMRPEGSTLDQDDIHVDVDGYEDMDGGPLLRDLTPLSWEQESNVSTGSDSVTTLPVPPSPVVQKSSKKSKGRKTRSR